MGKTLLRREVLTLGEAAHYLRLPARTLRKQAEQGHNPARRIGDTWRFLKAALDDWLRYCTPQQVLLSQAGVFKDDSDLPEILRRIYADRGRSETAG